MERKPEVGRESSASTDKTSLESADVVFATSSTSVSVISWFLHDRRSLRRCTSHIALPLQILTKELLLSAPPRSRRVTSSRKIKLLEKLSTAGSWILVRVPIERLVEVYATGVTAVALDEQGALESFTAIVNDG